MIRSGDPVLNQDHKERYRCSVSYSLGHECTALLLIGDIHAFTHVCVCICVYLICLYGHISDYIIFPS